MCIRDSAFLSEPESPTIVVDFIMLFSGYLNMCLAVVSQGLGCIFYSDLFITEGYKVDNQIFQIKRKSFFGYYKTSTSRLQKLCRFH